MYWRNIFTSNNLVTIVTTRKKTEAQGTRNHALCVSVRSIGGSPQVKVRSFYKAVSVKMAPPKCSMPEKKTDMNVALCVSVRSSGGSSKVKVEDAMNQRQAGINLHLKLPATGI